MSATKTEKESTALSKASGAQVPAPTTSTTQKVPEPKPSVPSKKARTPQSKVEVTFFDDGSSEIKLSGEAISDAKFRKALVAIYRALGRRKVHLRKDQEKLRNVG